MHWVNMTVFITHCWRRIGLELGAWLTRALLMAMLGLGGAWAQTSSVELTELMPVRKDNALLLNAQLKLELGPAVEDALIKGLAVHFVVDAEVLRERWYWTDKKTGAASRYYRLAFQPLTRRWRLNVSSEPISGTGLAGSISQNFETLAEALSVIRRQSAWKIADAQSLEPDTRQRLRYEFRLDVSQLPRPFQIAAGSQADWSLQVIKTLRLSEELVR
jgi:hypothetical protein